MAIQVLFTTETPVGTDNTDGTPGITTGVTFYADADGVVYGVRFFSTTSIVGNYTGAMWQVVGTSGDPDAAGGSLLASKTTAGAIASGTWNNILFDTPVVVTANTVYRMGLFNDTGRYVSTGAFYTGHNQAAGNLHALQDASTYFGGHGTLAQGTFTVNATLAYATSTFNGNNYFVDVLYGAGAVQPQLIAQYDVASAGNNTNTLTTASFVPGIGELLVVKMNTWDTAVAMNAPTGGSLTWTSRVIGAPGGFHGWTGIYTAAIGTTSSPGSITVSAAPASTCRHNLVVERWAGAQLAATPATDAGAGSLTSSLTTTAAHSAITWCGVDESSIDPSARAYAGSAVEEYIDDGHVGTNTVGYYAYQAVAAAGATTYGLTAPASAGMNFAALELQALGASPPAGLPPQNLINNRAALARAFNW